MRSSEGARHPEGDTAVILGRLKNYLEAETKRGPPPVDIDKKMALTGSGEGTYTAFLQSEVTQLKGLFFKFVQGEAPYADSTEEEFYQLLKRYEQLLQQFGPAAGQLHIDVKDEEGNTLLIVAALCNNNNAARLLLGAGANIHLFGADGQTAYMLANAGIKKLIIQTQKTSIAKLLSQYSKRWAHHSTSMLQALERFLGPALGNPKDDSAGGLLALLQQSTQAEDIRLLIKKLEFKLLEKKPTKKIERNSFSFSERINTIAKSPAVFARSKSMWGPAPLAPEENKPTQRHKKIDQFRKNLKPLQIVLKKNAM